jgi:hypothetical protein
VKRRSSSVGIATGYGLDDRGSIPGRGWEFFSSAPRPDRYWGPPSLLSNRYREVKRPGPETDYWPPSSAEVKNVWSYTSIPNTSSWHSA